MISQINSATGNNGRVVAGIDSAGTGLQLTDTTGGSGSTSVAEVGGGHTAADLGLLGVTDSGSHVLSGNPLLAGLNSVLLRNLNGQAGVTGLGTISIQDRSGGSATVDLSNCQSVSDVIAAINNATGVSVHAALNSAGDGIEITDTSGGTTDNFQVADVGGGQTAEKLNLATNSAATTVNSGNLSLRYVSENSTLSSLGVASGKFVITNGSGQSATIDLTSGSVNTLGNVINLINNSGINVTASIDSSGTGLLLTDNSGGSGQMKVAEDGSTTASDLGILGTANSGQIDGTQQVSISVSSTDTLQDVADAINRRPAR